MGIVFGRIEDYLEFYKRYAVYIDFGICCYPAEKNMETVCML